MLAAINNATVTNKNASKTCKFCILPVAFFSLESVKICRRT